jgi:hypothetical protein
MNPFAALGALARRRIQEALVALWEDVGLTLIFLSAKSGSRCSRPSDKEGSSPYHPETVRHQYAGVSI